MAIVVDDNEGNEDTELDVDHEDTATLPGPAATEPADSPDPVDSPSPSLADWRDGITDKAARAEAEKSTTLNDFAARIPELRKQLSSAVFKPGKDATEIEVAAFRKAMGVPEAIADYTFDVPEGMSEEELASDDFREGLKEFAETAHRAGMSDQQFKDIVSWYLDSQAAEREAVASTDNLIADQAAAELQADWGANYETEKRYANRGAEYAFGDDFDDFKDLTTADGKLVGDTPMMVRAMNRVGRAKSEDTISTFPADAETAQGLQAQLDKLTEQQFEASQRQNYTLAQSLDLKIMELSRRIGGDGPIQGAG